MNADYRNFFITLICSLRYKQQWVRNQKKSQQYQIIKEKKRNNGKLTNNKNRCCDPCLKFTRLLSSVDRNELNCCARLQEHGKIGSCNNFVVSFLFFFQSYGLSVPIEHVCLCVCVCMHRREKAKKRKSNKIHTHTPNHIHIHIQTGAHWTSAPLMLDSTSRYIVCYACNLQWSFRFRKNRK